MPIFKNLVKQEVTKKSSDTTHDEEEEGEEEDDEDDDEEDVVVGEECESSETNVISTLSGKRNHPLMMAMWALFDHVKEATNEAGQSLIEPFVKLPSKRVYPDYFEEIKRPISLNQIKHKLNKRVYNSLADLGRDFELMFNNAMQYNVEESVIYGVASKLMRILREKSAELASTSVGELVVKSEASDANTPSKVRRLGGGGGGAGSDASPNAAGMTSGATPGKKANLYDVRLCIALGPTGDGRAGLFFLSSRFNARKKAIFSHYRGHSFFRLFWKK